MSFSYQKLNPVKVIDPITRVNSVNDYAVLESGNKVQWKAYTSTSISSSSIQFSCPPPSSNIIIDRDQRLTLPIRLSFTGRIRTTNGAYTPNATLLNEGKDAPRSFPISSAMETLQVSINNDSVSINLSDMVHALTRYNIGPDVRAKDYSMTPNYPDQSQNYSDLDGTNRNSLGNYAEGSADAPTPRGGFPFTVVANTAVAAAVAPGTAATAIVDMVITENLFLSPFFWGCACKNSQGFFNVNAMDFNLNFLAQAGFRMWSHSNAPVAVSGADSVFSDITAISVQFNGFSPAFSYSQSQPQMLFKYYTPNVLMPLSQNVPYTYSYSELARYPTDIGTLTYAQGPQIFNSNNIQMNQIPRRMYVFARPSNAVLQSRADITDTFLAITNVSIQFANQNSVLGTATQAQLFALNCKNHSEQSWNEWSGQGVYNSGFPGTAGYRQFSAGAGPLCLEFGTDIQLEGNEAPGLAGQYQIQVAATLQNTNSGTQWDALQMTLYLVMVYEGTFTITSVGSAQHQLGVLSKNDILDAQTQVGINYRTIQDVNGGDFMSSLADFGSKVNDFLRNTKAVSRIASQVPHPIAQTIGNIASSLGYGEGCDGGYNVGGVAVGGKRGKRFQR